MNQVHQRKRSSTCSIAAECSWPGRMSTPPPVGQTSQRWQGKRRRRSRRSCRANHPRRRRQDKIALSPSGGSGSTGCGAGCSSRQWRGRWSRRSRRLHRGQSQLQPQLPGSFAPSVESKFVLINACTFPTKFDILAALGYSLTTLCHCVGFTAFQTKPQPRKTDGGLEKT